MSEARAALDKAVALDSFSPAVLVARATFAYLDGDLESAAIDARRALQLDPDFFRAHLRLGLVHLMRGESDGALARIDTARRLSPEMPETIAALAHAYAVTGQAAVARRLLTEHEARLSFYDRAIVLAGLGMYRQALMSLTLARKRKQLVPGLFAYEPRLSVLNRFSEFRELREGRLPAHAPLSLLLARDSRQFF